MVQRLHLGFGGDTIGAAKTAVTGLDYILIACTSSNLGRPYSPNKAEA